MKDSVCGCRPGLIALGTALHFPREGDMKGEKMNQRFVGTAAVWLLILSMVSIGHAGESFPGPSLDILLRINSVAASPQWYPDGSRIVFSSGLNPGGMVCVHPDGGFPQRLPFDLGGTGHFLMPNLPAVSPDGRWIAYFSNKNGSPELWAWSIEDGRDICLTRLGGRINAFSWSPDSRWIAFSGDVYGDYDVWKISIPDGEAVRLTRENVYEVYPTWTPDSRHILFVRMDESWIDHEIVVISAEGENPRVILSDENFFDYYSGGKFGYPRVSPDGKLVFFRSYRSGWINYWLVPFEGGEPRPLSRENADQSEAEWSPDGRSIVYTSNHNGTVNLCVASVSSGKSDVWVAPKTGVCSSPRWSPDGKRISYLLQTPTRPGDVYIVDKKNRSHRRLTESMPSGNLERSLIRPEKIQFSSPDGLTIHAYLYKPRKILPGDKYPGILWIHGGPTSQFSDTFQSGVQYMVSRGYVVLLPNIRGSSGFGRAFADANNRCWGRCDLQDVIAGAEYLKKQEYVDADNMGITGTSYGGIMSMAAITNAPGYFQAAVPCSGYGDWIWACTHAELRHVKLWDYEIGPWRENKELYRELSPINHVTDIQTPVFLIHGEGLYPGSEQSRLFAVELERHYKVFRHKAYPGENYYVRSRKNRRRMLLDMADFFDQYLKTEIRKK